MARFRAWVLLLFFLGSANGWVTARAGDIAAERQGLYAEYREKLSALAAQFEERKMDDAAHRLRTWLPERRPDRLTLFVLDAGGDEVEGEEADKIEWIAEWRKLRDQQADRLFEFAARVVNEGHPSLAYELVTEAVRENPDHKQARRLLGYVRFRDAWRTPFEVHQLSAGKVWHERFGWLPQGHVERYEEGERYYQGRWMPAAEESELRGSVKRGWRIESPHYVVTTNHSLEEGVRLSHRLETLYSIWQQVFVSFLADEAELKRRFAGRPARIQPKQHNVVYYRTRGQYNDALRAAQPKIEMTLGIYLDNTRTAYFFAGDEQDPGTLYHEATHQLFQETRPADPSMGRQDNFWVIEGVACYMESLAREGYHYTLGGMDSGRMPAARHRLLEDKFYVPLAELVQIGMEDLQNDGRIAMLYSQSSGLAGFFMHDESGRYREPLVHYLGAVYSGRATPRTLAEATRTDYDTLDRQYRAFMSAGVDTAQAPAEAAR